MLGGGVQTESVATDNVNSKQSTPDSNKQDSQKIETNTLNTEKPAQNLNTQALFATSKVQTSNANTDLATQTDPSKLSKDNFADGTHWTPAGWTTASPTTKVAKESKFIYENPDPIDLDVSNSFRVLGGKASVSATIDKNDIVKGNKILVATIQSTKGNKQQNQRLAFTEPGYLNGTENGINFNGRNIGYLHSEWNNNLEIDWYLNVTDTINFATDPKFTFNLNNVSYEFNIPSVNVNGIDAGPNYAEGAKDVGNTYYLVTNSQIVPIKIIASRNVKPSNLPNENNTMYSVYNDPNPSSHNNYAGAQYTDVSSTKNLTGVEKISAVNTKFDPNSPIGVAYRTKYFTVYNNQIYWDQALPANNPWNYNPYASKFVKTVKLANNLSASDVLAQTPENTITASYQSDGSYITAWNISPKVLGSGGEDYVKALAPNGSTLNLQLADHKQQAIDDTVNYYKNRDYIPSAFDLLLIFNTNKDKTVNDVVTVTDLSPNTTLHLQTKNYIVNGATFNAELYKTANVQYIDDVTNKVISRDSITGVRDQDFTYKINIPKGYVLASNSNGSNYRFDNNYQNVIYTFNKDQAFNDKNPITIHLTHGRKAVADSNTIGETIHYVFENGSKALDNYVAKPVASTRIGHKDLVTGETIWDSDWSTETFNKVAVPKLDGFTPDQTEISTITVNGESPDIVKTVTYRANNQKITVKYIDDTTKSVLATKELTGKSNTDAGYNTQDTIKVYVNSGYDLVSDNTQGQALKFDSKDAVDQNYEVHLKHHISKVVDPKLLNAEFNRIVTEFLPTGKNKELKRHYVITRTGTQDQVTKEYKFSNWSTINVHKDQGDTFDGYTARIQKQTPNGIASLENKVPVVKAEVFTNQNNNSVTPVNVNEVVEIVYDANTQKAFVKYIDDTTKKVLDTKELTGKTNTDSKYTTQDSIKNYLAKGYDLVSDNTNGKSIIFDSKDAVDQNYEVHLKHHISDVVDPKLLNASFDRVIVEHVPKSKDKWINQHYVITRTGTQDQVTKEYTFTDWSKADVHEDLIDNFEGYTASPKGLNINKFMVNNNGKWSAKAETFTNDRNIINPVNLTEVAEIDYVANPQEATIVYYDDTADKVLERNVSHGKFDETIKFNPEVMAVVKKYQDQHYKLTGNEFDNQTYKSDDKNNVFVVHFVHEAKPETREKTVTETVHYVDANNQKLHDDVVKSKVFTNKGTRDLVTDTVKWDDLWSPETSTFDKVVSPEIDGYTPDQDAVAIQNVDSNSKDLEFTVHYTKNPKDAKLIKSETFDVKQKDDTKEQKAVEKPAVKSDKIETVQPAQVAIENKVPTGPVNVVYNNEQVVKVNDEDSKTTHLTGTMASVLPQTGSRNDNTLAYAGLLCVSLVGLINGIGTSKKKRN